MVTRHRHRAPSIHPLQPINALKPRNAPRPPLHLLLTVEQVAQSVLDRLGGTKFQPGGQVLLGPPQAPLLALWLLLRLPVRLSRLRGAPEQRTTGRGRGYGGRRGTARRGRTGVAGDGMHCDGLRFGTLCGRLAYT